MKKKIVLFCPTFEIKNLHYGKDVGQIIEGLKELGNYTHIITKKNEEKYANYKSEIILIENELFGFITNILKVRPNSLIMFHGTIKVFIYCIIFKIINPFGKIYIKSDTDLKNLKYYKNGEINTIYYIYMSILTSIAILSFENSTDVNLLKNKYNINVIHIPNGVSNDKHLDIIKLVENKEKLIVTVGRIGTTQKNSKEFINIVKEVLKKFINYKVILIGDIVDETGFKDYIKELIKTEAEVMSRISFVGNVSQKRVFEYFKESKFFILTSLYEGFACVLPEAAYYGNIIVASDVGGVYDTTNNGKNGFIYKKIDDGVRYINKVICNNKLSKRLAIANHDYIQNNLTYNLIVKKIDYLLD